MPPKKISPYHELAGDAFGKFRESLVEECGKSIEVGKCVGRPFDLYSPGHGRNPDVPHVRSHCTTRS